MTKQFLPRTIIAALIGASVVALAPAGAQGVERRRCARPTSAIVSRHQAALCRSLARRAERERPSREWSAAWTDRCSWFSENESHCTFRMVFRDHSEPRSARRPRRVCRGEATVTGTSRFHVAYADGCVYPDEGNA
jgi:hypothetical protein